MYLAGTRGIQVKVREMYCRDSEDTRVKVRMYLAGTRGYR